MIMISGAFMEMKTMKNNMEDIDWPEYIEELWDSQDDVPNPSGDFDWYFVEDLEDYHGDNSPRTRRYVGNRLSSGKYIDEDID